MMPPHLFDHVVALGIAQETLEKKGAGRPRQVDDLAPPVLLRGGEGMHVLKKLRQAKQPQTSHTSNVSECRRVCP